MSDDFNVEATSREVFGKGASRRLRRENLVPAILYGGEGEPEALNLKHNEVLKYTANEGFYSQLLMLSVDGKEPIRTVLRDIQRHPYKQQIMHLDFQRVVAGAELQVTVPIHYINEETCIGVKQEGGMISHIDSEITVACRPRDIPSSIEVDMAELKIGDSIHLSDIAMPENVRIVDLGEAGDDSDRVVAAVVQQRKVEEETEVAAEGEEGAAAADDSGDAGDDAPAESSDD